MIKLSENTFQVIPEGVHTFQIIGVNYKKDFGKLEIKLATAKGEKHTENFSLARNGEINEGGVRAFSYFARVAMNNNSLSEIDENELVGKFIDANVKHTVQPNKNDPSKTVTFVNLSDYAPSQGFATAATEPADLDF